MKNSKQIDLIHGPILKSLIALAMPIMTSYFLNTVYNITDMAWIGMLGSRAVAGAGVGGMYLWLSQGLASLARMGGQVNVAQSIGQEEREEAGEYARAAVQLGVIFAGMFAAICLLFTRHLVEIFRLSDTQTVRDAVVYMKITCGLVVFSHLTVVLTGIYTAQGDSRTPLRANFLGLVLNMFLDPMLILGVGPFPRMEVVGAAVATVLAQFVAMMVLILGILRDRSGSNVLTGAPIIKRAGGYCYTNIFRIGIPTAIQGSVYCLISMGLTRIGAIFGPEAVAVLRVGGQIESISWNTADGFASAINSFSAQNYGAQQMERVRKGYRISFWTITLWGLLITFIFLGIPEYISRIFFHEVIAIRMSIDYLRIIGLTEAFMCIELMTVGALSGLGRTKLCSVISILFTSARIPLAMVLSATPLGLNGLWVAMTVTTMMKGIIFAGTFKYVTRK